MIDIETFNIKVKGDLLVIKAGIVIEDKLMSVPLELVPAIKWDKDVKLAVINELIRKDRLDIVLAMQSGKHKAKEFVETVEKSSAWKESDNR